MARKSESTEISVLEISTGIAEFCILGTSPLVFNRLGHIAKGALLFPPRKKNRAERETTMKHDPLAEYQGSVHRRKGDDGPTRLVFWSAAFKRAVASAALDMPGARKAEIGRRTWITGTNVDVYGVPQMYMATVKQAGMNHTPDIRTRAIVPNWGCKVAITYVQSLLKLKDIGNLMAAAGVLIGIGDGRQEKGALSFGQFEIVGDNDPRFLALMKNGGRVAQDRALAEPSMFDDDTAELYEWFCAEVKRRNDEPPREPRGKKKKGGNGKQQPEANA